MLNRNNKYLIFDTYLNKNDEINLNYKLNNVPTIFKSPKYENILSFIKIISFLILEIFQLIKNIKILINLFQNLLLKIYHKFT